MSPPRLVRRACCFLAHALASLISQDEQIVDAVSLALVIEQSKTFFILMKEDAMRTQKKWFWLSGASYFFASRSHPGVPLCHVFWGSRYGTGIGTQQGA